MKKLSESDIQFYTEMLSHEGLIGVSFHLKEGDAVLLVGSIAGCGYSGQASNIWDALDTTAQMFETNDKEIAEQFGKDVATPYRTPEEDQNKQAAIQSLASSLMCKPGIVSVQDAPKCIMVQVSNMEAFDGPWTWQGYSVYSEYVDLGSS